MVEPHFTLVFFWSAASQRYEFFYAFDVLMYAKNYKNFLRQSLVPFYRMVLEDLLFDVGTHQQSIKTKATCVSDVNKRIRFYVASIILRSKMHFSKGWLPQRDISAVTCLHFSISFFHSSLVIVAILLVPLPTYYTNEFHSFEITFVCLHRHSDIFWVTFYVI